MNIRYQINITLDLTRGEVYAQVRNPAWDQVYHQLYTQVRDSLIRDQIKQQIKLELL